MSWWLLPWLSAVAIDLQHVKLAPLSILIAWKLHSLASGGGSTYFLIV